MNRTSVDTNTHQDILGQFSHLPVYAQFLLDNRLNTFVQFQLKESYKLDVPLLRLFAHHTEEELLRLGRETAVEWLGYLSRNQGSEYIQLTTERWKKNQLPQISKDTVAAEDITRIAFLRKKSLLHFITEYSTDTQELIALIQEIDVFIMEWETASANTYINILKDRIDEHSHFIEKITNTTPGIIYVYDVIGNKEVYANKTITEFIGFAPQEMLNLESDFVEKMIHPEDIPVIKQYETAFETAADGEIRSVKYRIRTKDGLYKWMRAYETVFKRMENGKVWQKIGIAIDVNTEMVTANKLKESEARYRQAEKMAQMGNWSWDITQNKLEWTDQLYEIYGLDRNEEITIHKFLDLVHPDDRESIKRGMDKALQQENTDLTFRIVCKDGRVKTLQSMSQIKYNKEGQPVSLFGTEIDITEKQYLIDQLQHNDHLFRQAQSLAHIGNWSYNLMDYSIQWSEELYRIFGLDSKETIDFEKYTTLLHEDDKLILLSTVEKALKDGKPYELYHRITLKDGTVKMLHARGEVIKDEKGQAIELVGTAQDVTERQLLLDKYEQSEKLYKQAQALSHLGNWTLDLDSREFEWSDEMYRIYKLPLQTKISESVWAGFIHPDDKEAVLAYLKVCVENAAAYEKVHRIVLPGGEVKYILRKGEFVKNAAGRAVKMIGTSQDITAQIRIQQELEENQHFISKIANAAPSIIALHNLHTGVFSYISEGMKKLLGYSVEGAKEQGHEFFLDLIHPEDRESFRQKNQLFLTDLERQTEENKNEIAEYKFRLRHKNGAYRWFHTYATVFDRNALGGVEHILEVSLDITDQVAAQQKIEEQELFIQQVADASPTILYIYDLASSSVVYVNKEVYFVLGYTTEEMQQMGASVTKTIYHPEEYHLLPERKESNKKFQHPNSMIQYECRIKAKDDQWKWLLVREIIFKMDENGNPLQLLGAALDITKRKEMERSLLQNSFQLEQSNASLEEFAYVASHDLKEPLRKISTFGDRLIVSQAQQLTEDGRIYLKKIIDASQRMQVMISDLLSISMISGNNAYENFSLQSILEDVKQTLEFKIENKNAVIEAADLPEIYMIPSQFRQLFQNLLSNSLKFARENVQPLIQINWQWLLPEQVRQHQLPVAHRYLQLDFRDNGIGFEEEYAGKIFQIFQRLHGRSEYEGTGIGLAICKKIVEHHGGIIFGTGKMNQGATFTIILPA